MHVAPSVFAKNKAGSVQGGCQAMRVTLPVELVAAAVPTHLLHELQMTDIQAA